MSAARRVPEAGSAGHISDPLEASGADPALVVGPEHESASRARERVSGHLAWNFGSELAARGASLWLAFFCARILGVAEFGRFSFALAAAQYAWLAGDAALNSGYATRETARDRGATADQAGLFWTSRVLAAALLMAIYLVVTYFLPLEAGTRRALMAATVYFIAYAAFPDWALRGMEDFRGLALANLVYSGCLIASSLLLLPAHPDPALGLSLWGGCFALAAVVALARLRRQKGLRLRPAFTITAWAPHVKRSSLFSLGSIAAIGYTQLPILLAGVLTGPREVGLFSAGFRLLLAFIGTLTILWWPLMPVLTREHPASPVAREVLASSASLVLAVSVPVALALTLFPTDVLAVLFGRGYEAGAASLAIGAWILPLYALCGLLEQVNLAQGGERLRAVVSWTTLAAMAALSLLLVPRLGSVGAALTSVAGFALALGFYAARLRRVVQLADVFRPLVRVGFACGVLGLFWLTVSPMILLPAWAFLIAGAALYVPLAMRLGLLRLAPGLAWPWRAR